MREEAKKEAHEISIVRSGLNKLFIFFKLREARSLLYRRRFLQVNIRWKALDEIYKMYIPLHRSDLKIPAKSRHNFGKNESIQDSIHSNFRKFDMKIAISLLNFDEILSEFHGSVQILKCPNSLRNAEKWKKKGENPSKFRIFCQYFFVPNE